MVNVMQRLGLITFWVSIFATILIAYWNIAVGSLFFMITLIIGLSGYFYDAKLKTLKNTTQLSTLDIMQI